MVGRDELPHVVASDFLKSQSVAPAIRVADDFQRCSSFWWLVSLSSKMMDQRIVKLDYDGNIDLEQKRKMIIGEFPGSWIALGLGTAIIFIGLGYIENDIPLVACAVVFLVYSAAVVLHTLLRLSPY